jgi:hypothetical protein
LSSSSSSLLLLLFWTEQEGVPTDYLLVKRKVNVHGKRKKQEKLRTKIQIAAMIALGGLDLLSLDAIGE